MAIDKKTVLHTAVLARLDIRHRSEAEIDALTAELDAILEYVAQLDALDTTGVEPTTHAVPLEMPLRPDEPLEGPGRDAILSNAPETSDGFFVVPRIIAD